MCPKLQPEVKSEFVFLRDDFISRGSLTSIVILFVNIKTFMQRVIIVLLNSIAKSNSKINNFGTRRAKKFLPCEKAEDLPYSAPDSLQMESCLHFLRCPGFLACPAASCLSPGLSLAPLVSRRSPYELLRTVEKLNKNNGITKEEGARAGSRQLPSSPVAVCQVIIIVKFSTVLVVLVSLFKKHLKEQKCALRSSRMKQFKLPIEG
ncbi:hypothetical protein WN51_08422 [Melipona quadrifasciata]|uniref:Uncharacterized protein n=1 Tax=Melipona quadrifasciata TaxID=166423 RepID=A0A0M9A9Y8_9HYME|nr:hypothetical protein WN51_08422 [Melipona quadrifasciata]